MKVTAERIEKNTVTMTVELDETAVSLGVEEACRTIAGKVNIPGFRKGKTPRKVLEMHVGREALMEEAADRLVQEYYGKALTESGMEPVARPEVDIPSSLEEGKPFVFSVRMIVKPEVTLGQYKDLAIARVIEPVTEEEITEILGRLQTRHAKQIVIEDEPVQSGDYILLDFEGFFDGVPFEGGKAEAYPMVVGSGQFIPGFEEQLIGMMKDESREITVTFPEEYPREDMGGKEATFQVRISEIKRRVLPELNDDLAKETGEADTLDELRQSLLVRLQHQHEHQAEDKHHNEILNTVVSAADLEVPEVMIDERARHLLSDLKERLERDHLTMEGYLEYLGTTEEELMERYHQSAEQLVKTELTAVQVAKIEGLNITDEELMVEIEKMAKSYQQDANGLWKKLKKNGSLELIREDQLMRKAYEFLYSVNGCGEAAINCDEHDDV